MECRKEGGLNHPRKEHFTVRVSFAERRVKFNLQGARLYLTGIENLAREARTSADPRVILRALAILGRQRATVTELGIRP
jgi:hypothetical protein